MPHFPITRPAIPFIDQHPDLAKSLLFSPEFDVAIIGSATRSKPDVPVLIYSEEKLVQVMYK